MPQEQIGELALLNVGTGDTKLSFDPKNPTDIKKASAVIKDMLKKGYAILIEVGHDAKGPLYRRALDFDPETLEYIVAGLPAATEESPIDTTRPMVSQTSSGERRRKNATRSAAKRTTSRVSARTTKGVAVAPTAGG